MAVMGYKIVGPDGAQSAEFDSDTLVAHARQGTIQPYTMIFDPTVGQVVPAGLVAALQVLGPAPEATTTREPYPSATHTPRATVVVATIVLALAVIAFVIWSCYTPDTQTVTSTDGRYAVSVPYTWRRLRESAPMVRVYFTHGQVLDLVELPATSSNLDAATARIEAGEVRRYSVAMPGVVSTTVSGYSARQFDVQYTDPDDRRLWRSRQTVIATPDGLYDVIQFGYAEDAAANRIGDDQILASFRASGQ